MRRHDIIQVRDLQAADADRIETIWRRSGLVRDEEDAAAEIEMLLSLSFGIAIGAVIDSVLVGVVFGQDERRRGWMGRLAVHPDFQRQGIGKALVVEMEHRLISSGVPRVELYVDGANEAGRAFYVQMGYRLWPELVVTTKWFTPTGR